MVVLSNILANILILSYFNVLHASANSNYVLGSYLYAIFENTVFDNFVFHERTIYGRR